MLNLEYHKGQSLGPCLFLFYINDLPNGLASKVRLFADDAISYMTIDNQQDAHNLQQDLNRIGEWAKKWTMVLNTEKCKVITISRKRNKIQHVYHLNNTPLEAVTSAKYLGVTITSDLKWTQHINTVVNKANSTLAFLRRNLRIKSSDLKATEHLQNACSTDCGVCVLGVGPCYKQPNSPTRNGAKKSCKIHSQSLPQYIKRQQYAEWTWVAHPSKTERKCETNHDVL